MKGLLYPCRAMWDLTYALAEEIGDPDLFVGREKEMARLMKWAAGTKHLVVSGAIPPSPPPPRTLL